MPNRMILSEVLLEARRLLGQGKHYAYVSTANHVVRSDDGVLADRTYVEFYDDQGIWHAAQILDRYEPAPQDLAVLRVEKPEFMVFPECSGVTRDWRSRAPFSSRAS